MDSERFLRLLNSGRQEDYGKLSDEILQYTASKARGLPNIDDAATGALAKIEDLLIEGKSLDSWELVKTIIDNYIKDLRRKQGPEDRIIPSYVLYASELWPKRGYPKDRILELPEGNEKEICLLYWQDGLGQSEIAKELNVSEPYVSKIINRHKKPMPESYKTDRFDYPYPRPKGGFAIPFRDAWDNDDE